MKGRISSGAIALVALLTVSPGLMYAPPAHAQGGESRVEGIKVHGRWVIEIRDPDGTLVTHREFDNGLTGIGKEHLRSLLGERGVARYWAIELGSSGAGLCFNESGSNVHCLILEDDDPKWTQLPNVSRGLSREVTGDGEVILRGAATAMTGGQLDYVMTNLETYVGASGAYGSFTNSYLPQPIAVQQGQSIAVTVTFSFS